MRSLKPLLVYSPSNDTTLCDVVKRHVKEPMELERWVHLVEVCKTAKMHWTLSCLMELDWISDDQWKVITTEHYELFKTVMRYLSVFCPVDQMLRSSYRFFPCLDEKQKEEWYTLFSGNTKKLGALWFLKPSTLPITQYITARNPENLNMLCDEQRTEVITSDPEVEARVLEHLSMTDSFILFRTIDAWVAWLHQSQGSALESAFHKLGGSFLKDYFVRVGKEHEYTQICLRLVLFAVSQEPRPGGAMVFLAYSYFFKDLESTCYIEDCQDAIKENAKALIGWGAHAATESIPKWGFYFGVEGDKAHPAGYCAILLKMTDLTMREVSDSKIWDLCLQLVVEGWWDTSKPWEKVARCIKKVTLPALARWHPDSKRHRNKRLERALRSINLKDAEVWTHILSECEEEDRNDLLLNLVLINEDVGIIKEMPKEWRQHFQGEITRFVQTRVMCKLRLLRVQRWRELICDFGCRELRTFLPHISQLHTDLEYGANWTTLYLPGGDHPAFECPMKIPLYVLKEQGVNFTNKKGMSPLLFALFSRTSHSDLNQHYKKIKHLFEAGANPLKTYKGMTMLEWERAIAGPASTQLPLHELVKSHTA